MPTDMRYEAEAEKKRRRGLVPQIDITPPVQNDWRQAIEPAPVAAAQPDPASALRHQIELRRRRQQLASEQGMIVQTPSTGMDLQTRLARAAAIRERGQAIGDIDTALAPVRSEPQSTGQIIDARDDLRSQGIRQAILMQKRALAEKDSDAFAQASRAQAEFQTSPAYDPIDPDQAAAIQARQQQMIRAAQVRRQVAAAAAGADLRQAQEASAVQRALVTKGDELEGARLDSAIAQERQAGAEAQIGADPDIIKRRIAAEQAVSRANANTATRGAARANAGLGSDEAYSAFDERASQVIGAGDVSGFANTIVPQLQQIAEIDPQEAARIAAGMINQIDQAAPSVIGSMMAHYGFNPIAAHRNLQHSKRVKIREILGTFIQ